MDQEGNDVGFEVCVVNPDGNDVGPKKNHVCPRVESHGSRGE